MALFRLALAPEAPKRWRLMGSVGSPPPCRHVLTGQYGVAGGVDAGKHT